MSSPGHVPGKWPWQNGSVVESVMAAGSRKNWVRPGSSRLTTPNIPKRSSPSEILRARQRRGADKTIRAAHEQCNLFNLCNYLTSSLHIIVEEEFIRVRPQAQGIVLFAFGANPHLQKICCEDVSL